MKRKHISFIMPFIDFAFMVIIIFVALLSIAYFEPPGSGGKEIKIKPLQKEITSKEQLISTKTKIQISKIKNTNKNFKTTKEIRKLKNIINKQQAQIKLLSLKIIKLKQTAKIKSTVKISPAKNISQPSAGKHLYTDLRNY